MTAAQVLCLPEAVVFDLDGTLAETERDGHRVAFNEAFAAHCIRMHWDVDHYRRLLAISGGRRRIAAELRAHGYGEPRPPVCARRGTGRPATPGPTAGTDADEVDALAGRVHRTKTALFAEQVRRGAIAPRPGVPELVADLVAAGVRIAVATTGTRAWAEPLLEHLLGAGTVEVAVYGDDVEALEPDPQAYRVALCRLGVDAAAALAVEDSAPGLRSARAAGLVTVVVTTDDTREDDLPGAGLVRASYDDHPPITASTLAAVLTAAGSAAGRWPLDTPVRRGTVARRSAPASRPGGRRRRGGGPAAGRARATARPGRAPRCAPARRCRPR